MRVDVRKDGPKFVGVVLDDDDTMIGVTKKCHDRKQALREAEKIKRSA